MSSTTTRLGLTLIDKEHLNLERFVDFIINLAGENAGSSLDPLSSLQKIDEFAQEVDERFESFSNLHFEIVQSLSDVTEQNIIYLIDKRIIDDPNYNPQQVSESEVEQTSTSANAFYEYIVVNDAPEQIGSTEIPKELFEDIEQRLAEVENYIELYGNKLAQLETKSQNLDDIVSLLASDLGLNSEIEKEYPTEEVQVPTYQKIQTHDDLLKIISNDLGLDDLADGSYPTEEVRKTTRELAEEKGSGPSSEDETQNQEINNLKETINVLKNHLNYLYSLHNSDPNWNVYVEDSSGNKETVGISIEENTQEAVITEDEAGNQEQLILVDEDGKTNEISANIEESFIENYIIEYDREEENK